MEEGFIRHVQRVTQNSVCPPHVIELARTTISRAAQEGKWFVEVDFHAGLSDYLRTKGFKIGVAPNRNHTGGSVRRMTVSWECEQPTPQNSLFVEELEDKVAK